MGILLTHHVEADMADSAAARRMLLLEALAEERAGIEWANLAARFAVDERTIRRDVDYLQRVLGQADGIDVQRGRISATRAGFGTEYIAAQMDRQRESKERIARSI